LFCDLKKYLLEEVSVDEVVESSEAGVGDEAGRTGGRREEEEVGERAGHRGGEEGCGKGG
jgi:hypothetical protein